MSAPDRAAAVEVWALGPAALARLGGALAERASPAEQHRAGRVPRQAPVRAAAYGLVRLVLGPGIADRLVRVPAGWLCLPAVPDLWLSLSHGAGGIALAHGAGPLGIDVEGTDQPWAELLPHFAPGLSPGTSAVEAGALWCALEALGKARRSGIAPLLDVPLPFEPTRLLVRSGTPAPGALALRARVLERGAATLALCAPSGAAPGWRGPAAVARLLAGGSAAG